LSPWRGVRAGRATVLTVQATEGFRQVDSIK
jgi:hypothetical protein